MNPPRTWDEMSAEWIHLWPIYTIFYIMFCIFRYPLDTGCKTQNNMEQDLICLNGIIPHVEMRYGTVYKCSMIQRKYRKIYKGTWTFIFIKMPHWIPHSQEMCKQLISMYTSTCHYPSARLGFRDPLVAEVNYYESYYYITDTLLLVDEYDITYLKYHKYFCNIINLISWNHIQAY